MSRKPLTREQIDRKRVHRRRRTLVYGTLIFGFWAFYAWQPWEFDLIPRKLPDPHPAVEPDPERLFEQGTRVLLITAHPDDSEFYIGGTLDILGQTAEIHQVIITDGDKGYYPFENHAENRRVRRAEAQASLEAWNGRSLTFLSKPDGRMRADAALVRELRAIIERQRPDYVLTFDGDYPPRMSHQDHRRTGEAATRAALEAGVGQWLMLFSTSAPNYVVDITDRWERKKGLLAIHASQFSGERLEGVTNLVASRAEEDGDRIGVTHGEGFRCIPIR
jgi:LmbE family N-acetylglucosaminyl deacetylase